MKATLEGNLNIKMYRCAECGKSYSKGALQHHMLTHSGSRPFACHICSKSFRQKVHLERHIATHTGEKPFQCSYCGKCFSRKDTCQLHLRYHEISML